MKLMDLLPLAKEESLASEGRSCLLGWMLALASLMFATGICLPILETKFLFSRDQHSLIGIAYGLFTTDDVFLAIVITGFSIVLPFAKLCLLAIIYTAPVGSVSPRMLRLLEAVSKWAMLDVLIIALLIFSLKSAPLANGLTMPGVYAFTFAALLSQFVSGRFVKQLEARQRST